jgi:hypothetical protein
MSESEDWSFGGRRVPGSRPSVQPRVSFERSELDSILQVYGRKVAEGEWRDYALDHLQDRAVFSVYRRASEMPIYRIEKLPAHARKPSVYQVIAPTGAILKRGHELAGVLRFLDRPKLSLVRA